MPARASLAAQQAPGPGGRRSECPASWRAGPAVLAALPVLQRQCGNQATHSAVALQRQVPTSSQPQSVGPQPADPQTTGPQTSKGLNVSEYARECAATFELAAAELTGSSRRMSMLRFDELIDSWYGTVVNAEQLVTTFAPGDQAARETLRAGYIMALDVLLAKAHYNSGTSRDDLLLRNNGRIPPWAWEQPYEVRSGYSAPLPVGGYRITHDPPHFTAVERLVRAAQNANQMLSMIPRPGAPRPESSHVEMVINGIQIVIYPDDTDVPDQEVEHTVFKLHSKDSERQAQTQKDQAFAHTVFTRERVLEGPEAPTCRVTIQSRYPPWRDPLARQTDGSLRQRWRDPRALAAQDLPALRYRTDRGLTAADIAGSQVTPYSGSLAFHEGQHIKAWLGYFAEHPPPEFSCPSGRQQPPVGSPEHLEYLECLDDWTRRWDEYWKEAIAADFTDRQ